MIGTTRTHWSVIAILLVAGCGRPAGNHSDTGKAASNAVLNNLARKLLDEEDSHKCVVLRREIYCLGKPGIDFLVEGVADPRYHRRIVTSSSDADSFHIVFHNGLRATFVDEKDAATTNVTDLSEAMDARLLHDDDYLNRYVERWWNGGSGIYMEECVDELTYKDSTPASRRVAHRYLQDYQRLRLDYDPTLPISKMPSHIKAALVKWKNDHYEGSSWQKMDELDAEFNAETNPPPLNITATDVPEPKKIPFTDKKDRLAYVEYYKRAYLRAAIMQGHVGMSCCLGDTPNRSAKIHGHYAGFSDANNAKVEAVKRDIERKRKEKHKQR
jgi:hypothetical protein